MAFHASAALSQSWPFERFVGVLDRLDRRSDQLMVALMYHRVDDWQRTPMLDPGLVSAAPEEFERQIAYLAKSRPLLSLEDMLEIRRGERSMPPGAVMVTFDDGYRDFLEVAWPVLQRYEVPATLFLPTSYPGAQERSYWWDRVHAALVSTDRMELLETPAGRLELSTPTGRADARRAIRDWVWATPHDQAMAAVDELVAALDGPALTSAVLDWGELRRLAAQGLAIAPQTLTHPMLNRMPPEHAHAEILGSAEDLTRELGSSPPAFAFPAGGYDDALVDWLRRSGFELAFTTERGGNDLRQGDWLKLRRVNIGCRSTLALVRAQLLSRVAQPDSRALALLAHR